MSAAVMTNNSSRPPEGGAKPSLGARFTRGYLPCAAVGCTGRSAGWHRPSPASLPTMYIPPSNVEDRPAVLHEFIEARGRYVESLNGVA